MFFFFIFGAQTQLAVPRLCHRWSFDNTSDSIGGATLTFVGNATIANGTLKLPGTGNRQNYAYAGAPLVYTLNNNSSVTIEAWFSLTSKTLQTKVFSFGSSMNQFIAFTPYESTTATKLDFYTEVFPLEVDTALNGGGVEAPNTTYHLGAVFNSGTNRFSYYLNGVLRGVASMNNLSISDIRANGEQLFGASYFDNADLGGSIQEMRVWCGPLQGLDVIASYANGPATVLQLLGQRTAQPRSALLNRLSFSNGTIAGLALNGSARIGNGVLTIPGTGSSDQHSDYAVLASSNVAAILRANAVTFEFYINTLSATQTNGVLMSILKGNNWWFVTPISTQNNGTAMATFQIGSNTEMAFASSASLGVCAHTGCYIAVVVDSANDAQIVYVNGQLTAVSTLDDGMLSQIGSSTAVAVSLGAGDGLAGNGGANAFEFNGGIAEVRIWNVAFTDADVLANFVAGANVIGVFTNSSNNSTATTTTTVTTGIATTTTSSTTLTTGSLLTLPMTIDSTTISSAADVNTSVDSTTVATTIISATEATSTTASMTAVPVMVTDAVVPIGAWIGVLIAIAVICFVIGAILCFIVQRRRATTTAGNAMPTPTLTNFESARADDGGPKQIYSSIANAATDIYDKADAPLS